MCVNNNSNSGSGRNNICKWDKVYHKLWNTYTYCYSALLYVERGGHRERAVYAKA